MLLSRISTKALITIANDSMCVKGSKKGGATDADITSRERRIGMERKKKSSARGFEPLCLSACDF